MIYKYLTLLVLAALLPCIAVCQGVFTINGKLSEEFNGSKLYFGIRDNNRVEYNKVDSVVVKNGAFYFSGKIGQINAFGSFSIKNGKSFYNKGFALKVGTNNCSLTIDSAMGMHVLIENSEANGILSSIDDLLIKYIREYKAKNNITGSFALPTELEKEVRNKQLEMLRENPDSYITLLLLYHLSLFDNSMIYLDRIMDIFYSLSAEIKKSPFGLTFEKEKNEIRDAYLSTKISQLIPVFKVKKFDGSLFSNEQLKGKPYMIAFSATWCLPCMKYQPTLKKLYDKYRSKGFEVVYFNMDDNVKTWSRHILTKKTELDKCIGTHEMEG